MRIKSSLILLLSTTSILAGPFIGTQMGKSWVDSNSDVSWRIEGGYKFLRYLGLEGAYAEYHNDNNSFFAGAEGFLPLTPKFSLTADIGGEYVMDSNQDNMTAGYGIGGTMKLRDSHIKLSVGWHQVNDNNINFIYGGLNYNFY